MSVGVHVVSLCAQIVAVSGVCAEFSLKSSTIQTFLVRLFCIAVFSRGFPVLPCGLFYVSELHKHHVWSEFVPLMRSCLFFLTNDM